MPVKNLWEEVMNNPGKWFDVDELHRRAGTVNNAPPNGSESNYLDELYEMGVGATLLGGGTSQAYMAYSIPKSMSEDERKERIYSREDEVKELLLKKRS